MPEFPSSGAQTPPDEAGQNDKPLQRHCDSRTWRTCWQWDVQENILTKPDFERTHNPSKTRLQVKPECCDSILWLCSATHFSCLGDVAHKIGCFVLVPRATVTESDKCDPSTQIVLSHIQSHGESTQNFILFCVLVVKIKKLLCLNRECF